MKLRGTANIVGAEFKAVGAFASVLVLLLAGCLCSGQALADEPSPPDVLDVNVVQNANAAAGTVTIEAVVKQTVDATAELEIDDPSGTAKLESGARTKRFNLRKGGAQNREQVQVDAKDKKPRTVRVRLRVLGANGQPWMIIEREVKVNQATAEAGPRRRVPVVRTLPDGTRMVEYVTSQEAVARGLPAEGKPAPPSPAPAADEKQEK